MVDGLDLGALAAFLRSGGAVRDPGDRPYGELHAQLIAGGKSNLTYRVTDGVHDWVVRRPPLGHVLATAHDMAREHRVMSALAATTVPVPEMVALCEDPAVMGAPFYVMQLRRGCGAAPDGPVRARSRTASAPTSRHRLVDTLADLHAVDPAAVGLADFGHPEGFLERQVRRWAPQLERSRTAASCPAFAELASALAAPRAADASAAEHRPRRLPPRQRPRRPRTSRSAPCSTGRWPRSATRCATSGCYRSTRPPRPAWQGSSPTAWARTTASPRWTPSSSATPPRTGLDVTPLPWYIALGYYKLAVICEGIHARHLAGQTVGPGFDRIGELVPPLVAAGSAALG